MFSMPWSQGTHHHSSYSVRSVSLSVACALREENLGVTSGREACQRFMDALKQLQLLSPCVGVHKSGVTRAVIG